MNDKRALDIGIVLCQITCIILFSYFIGDVKIGSIDIKLGIVVAMAVVAAVFAGMAVKDNGKRQQYGAWQERREAISQILLLSEEDTEAASWDIYGKTSIIFGRDDRGHKTMMGNQVDIDLRDTAFAGSVDREHAVMNYYNGEWYLEDLESENGVSVKKAGEEKKCKLASGNPCKIDIGDVIFLGLTKLKVR